MPSTNYFPSRRYAYMDDGDEARELDYEDFMDGLDVNGPDEFPLDV